MLFTFYKDYLDIKITYNGQHCFCIQKSNRVERALQEIKSSFNDPPTQVFNSFKHIRDINKHLLIPF